MSVKIRSSDFLHMWSILKEVSVQRGEVAYIVGGFVRDQALGIPSTDVDVAVCGQGVAFGQLVAKRLRAHVHLLHQEKGVVRIVWTSEGIRWQIDVSSVGKRGMSSDLALRDFTVNAIAVRIDGRFRVTAANVLAPRGALDDLRARCLKPVSSGIFRKDPVRLFRAARLAVAKGLKPTAELTRLAGQEARRIRRGTRERLNEEWWKMFALDRTDQAMVLLDQWGVLSALFPPLGKMKGVTQSGYHHLDVWQHTLEVLQGIQNWRRLIQGFPLTMKRAVETYMETPVISPRSTRGSLLKCAALFHDVAKPQTRRVWSDGKVTFYDHDWKGARVARRAVQWLKMSREEVDSVERIVALHLRPSFLRLPNYGAGPPSMQRSGGPLPRRGEGPPSTQRSSGPLPRRIVSMKGARRFFLEAKEDVMGILFFSLADRWAARGPKVTGAILTRTRRTARELFQIYETRYRSLKAKRLTDGREIMQTCGMKPGPLIGKILEAIEEARMTGEISNREEALVLAKALADQEA